MRKLIASVLLGLFIAPASAAVTGVALVHGTGKQTNALADYWTAAMVDSVRLGLPITFVVLSNATFGWIKAGQKGTQERWARQRCATTAQVVADRAGSLDRQPSQVSRLGSTSAL